MSDWEETVKERAAAMQEKWAGEGSAPFLRLVDGEVEPGTCWSCGEVMAAGEDDSRCDPCAQTARRQDPCPGHIRRWNGPSSKM